MNQTSLVKAIITGTTLQAVMVGLGKAIPALGSMPNFFAMAGTMLAAVTGALATRATSLTAATAAGQGALAGGVTSVIGGLLAVVTGQWPDFAVVQLLFPLISGGIGGAIGGVIGRRMGTPQPA